MRNRFDAQLELLHEKLIEMGNLCEKVISMTYKVLMDEDRETAREIIEKDSQIDLKERDIEGLCLKLLLQQQPVASDLRKVSAALKMITDMERIGDQAADIADLARFIDRNSVEIPKEIEKMADQTVRMVTESIDSFVKADLDLCRKVINDDDMVDESFEQVKTELTEMIYHRSIDAKMALDLLMTAKYMERIGDHAVNIAEWVEYSITGIHRNNEHQNRTGGIIN